MNEFFNLHGVSSHSMEAGHPLSVLSNEEYTQNHNAVAGLLWISLFTGICNIIVFFVAMCSRNFRSSLTVLKVSLVIISVLQSISTPPLALNGMGYDCHLVHCGKLVVVWFQSRRSGMVLHLLVALEFILTCHSQKKTKTLPIYCTVPVVLVVQLISILFYEFSEAGVALGVMDLVILITFIAYFPSKIEDKRVRKAFWTVLVSFLVTYFPNFVMDCVFLSYGSVSVEKSQIFLCLTNLRLLLDGYLCWVTSEEIPVSFPVKENLNSEETPNPAIEEL